jgi:putative phosphoesterase
MKGSSGRRTRVGVVTDTHVGDELAKLPGEVVRRLEGVDLIVHAGDMCDLAVLDELDRVAPVVAVRGNHDPPDCPLPDQTVIEIGGARLGITHGIRPALTEYASAGLLWATGRLRVEAHCRALARRLPPVDVLVFGHIHMPVRSRIGRTLFFSPGSVYQPELDPEFDWSSRARRAYRAVRNQLPVSYRTPAVGVIEVDGGEVSAHAVRLQ